MKSTNPNPPDAKRYKQSVPGGETIAAPVDSTCAPVDYAEVAAIFHHQQRNSDYLEAHRARITASYPGQWVAVFQGEVVGAGASFRALAEQVVAEGLPYNKVAFSRIAANGQAVSGLAE